MKFLSQEHQSIQNAIESKGLNIVDFAFVKRKGKLFIRYKESDSEFVLHRKTETVLDDNNIGIRKMLINYLNLFRLTELVIGK